jgi:hypothetical protein
MIPDVTEDIECLEVGARNNAEIAALLFMIHNELARLIAALERLSRDDLSQCRAYLGRIKYEVDSINGTKDKRYWYDAEDHSHTIFNRVNSPEHRVRGLNLKEKREILQAFDIEEKITHLSLDLRRGINSNSIIIPRSRQKRLSLKEIKDLRIKASEYLVQAGSTIKKVDKNNSHIQEIFDRNNKKISERGSISKINEKLINTSDNICQVCGQSHFIEEPCPNWLRSDHEICPKCEKQMNRKGTLGTCDKCRAIYRIDDEGKKFATRYIHLKYRKQISNPIEIAKESIVGNELSDKNLTFRERTHSSDSQITFLELPLRKKIDLTKIAAQKPFHEIVYQGDSPGLTCRADCGVRITIFSSKIKIMGKHAPEKIKELERELQQKLEPNFIYE